jgi:membrane fusion protein, multidrug efflux system
MFMRILTFFFCVLSSVAVFGETQSSSDIRVLVVPKDEATLSSGINARINNMPVDIGDTFDKGATLVEFDCGVYKAEFDKAQAEFDEAQKNYNAHMQLRKQRAISDLELTAAEGRVKKAKADLELRLQFTKYCIIKAPYKCRIVKKLANTHEIVPSGTDLLEIISSASLRAQILVPSSWYSKLKLGKEFSIYIDETKKEYKAKISQIGAKIDPASQSFEIIAEFTQPIPSLIAGMSGTAKIEA